MKFFITAKDPICGEITYQVSSAEKMLDMWRFHQDDVMLIQMVDSENSSLKTVFERCW